MIKIEEKVNSTGTKITIQEKTEYENSIKGELKGYDCPICLNRGFITILINDVQFVKFCKCMKIREIKKTLSDNGMNEGIFNTFSFETFKTKEEWQKRTLNKAKENVGMSNWFVITGITGCGKTHLCTSIFKEEIMKGKCKKGKYFFWKDEIARLKVLKKSTSIENQLNYEEALKELKSVDLLYIDDFLKGGDSFKEELDLAYQIINARYVNEKKTIISSELSKEEIGTLDMAIAGRMYQRCNGFWLDLIKEDSRNYRLNKGENI